jgi:hypothetical protein
MTTISKDAKLVTFINVFTVEPANQQRLVELLARVTFLPIFFSKVTRGEYASGAPIGGRGRARVDDAG